MAEDTGATTKFSTPFLGTNQKAIDGPGNIVVDPYVPSRSSKNHKVFKRQA